jgi:hypothetical protein
VALWPRDQMVFFADAANGTAVGNFGTILRTTDAGNTWNSEPSGVGHDLFGVSFPDPNDGTVVGVFGAILRRTTRCPHRRPYPRRLQPRRLHPPPAQLQPLLQHRLQQLHRRRPLHAGLLRHRGREPTLNPANAPCGCGCRATGVSLLERRLPRRARRG